MDSYDKVVFDVAVIGAGIAGLKAAETLVTKYNMKNIVVLEAQEKTGGRTETILLDGNPEIPIELGANWIHGIEVNYLVKC